MTSTNPTLFNRRLGAAVRAQRIMAGLSQEALGEQINVTFQQVQKYERGVNRISVETLTKIAVPINTTPHELIDAVLCSDEKTSHPDASVSDRQRLETVRRLANLPEKRQAVALKVIKALGEEEAA